MFFLRRSFLCVKFQTREDIIVMKVIVKTNSNAAIIIHAIPCCVIYKLFKNIFTETVTNKKIKNST